MTERVSRIVMELRDRLEELYGDRLERVVLFGSQARGDATPESDVDVLVVLRGEVAPIEEIRRTGALASELSLRYDADVAITFTASDRFENGDGPFLRNVREEGVLV